MDKRTRALYEEAMRVRAHYKISVITRDDAIRLIMPYLKNANIMGKAIAKKYRKKFRPFTIAEFLR